MLGRRMRALANGVQPGEAWLLAQALVLAPLAPLLLRFPLPRLDALGRRVSKHPGRSWSVDAVLRVVDAVIDAGAPVVRRGCTTRAVTSWLLLRRADQPVVLCFGVGTVNGRTEGHSWLALDDEPVCERMDPRPTFSCVARLEGAG